ncbi:hypothetical protein AYO44_15890 [Planctomycetaceae bacterium SCGC AG-212-F19]|nr:hypothetical protein AYO44_15890 [Planctomycetaceae bacterium SCGC AG-212-F19]
MSELHLAEPPPFARIQLTERADGIEITLRLRDFRAHWPSLVTGLVCSALAMSIFYAGYNRNGNDTELFVLFWFYAGVFGTLVLLGINLLFRNAVFTVAGNTLTVRRTGLLWGRRWVWPAGTLRWITVHNGITLIGPTHTRANHTRTLFPQERSKELAWVAQALRQGLRLQPETEPAPGEIAIGFIDAPWKEVADPGFLLALPGRLAVRHNALPGYQHEFFPAPGLDVLTLWRMWGGKARPVGPEQVQCKNAEDDAACMLVNRTDWPRAWLTVWCEDKAALQAALARFWGNESEDDVSPRAEGVG